MELPAHAENGRVFRRITKRPRGRMPISTPLSCGSRLGQRDKWGKKSEKGWVTVVACDPWVGRLFVGPAHVGA